MICFLFISLLAAASALPYNGTCPNVTLVENFDGTVFLGKWYELFVTPAPVTDYACVQYEFIPEGDSIKINGSYVSNRQQINVERTLRPVQAKTIGTQKPQNLADMLLYSNYIIATDYTSYGIEYQCYYDNLTDTHAYLSFVGFRSLQVPDEAKTKINDFFKNNIPDLDLSKFTPIDFSEEACKYTSSEKISYTNLSNLSDDVIFDKPE